MSRVAEQQCGVISRSQLLAVGLSRATISRWTADGWLHRVHPRVYAVGHRHLSSEGRLAAAILYAGADGTLSHGTAAWWWRLIDHEPETIELTVASRRRSLPAVRLYQRRTPDRTRHRRFPVTTVPQTLVDFAVVAAPGRLRRALAVADYLGLLDHDRIRTALRRGHPGSAALREAIAHHCPELALTRSELEESFLALCEAAGFPSPRVNTTVHGMTVDALWPEQRVIVELDGHQAHRTSSQVNKDRDWDMRLRAAGYLVLRYTTKQVSRQREQVQLDLLAALEARSATRHAPIG